jgi:signal transduction histidine kinase/CheY-like chemotaxis protein
MTDLKNKEYLGQFKLFGLFGLINYPIFQLIPSIVNNFYDESFIMRLIAVVLCLGLICIEYWPERLKKFSKMYWYFTVTYCLPFFCSYMFVLNQGANDWVVNNILAVFLLIIILNWVEFFLVMSIGILLGIIFEYFIHKSSINISYQNIITTGIDILWMMAVSLMFSHNKEAREKEKTKNLEKIRQVNKLLNQKVALKTSELVKALAVKTEILNNLNHEIRTPIQAFTSISAGLVEHWYSFDDSKKYSLAAEIAKNSTRLFSLVASLLEIANPSIKANSLKIVAESIDEIITEMIEECSTMYAQKKNIKLTYYNQTSVPYGVLVNKEKINQVLRNIIINAIKFSYEDGEIIITLKKIKDNFQITIADQGVGIPKEDLKRIFIPFYQTARARQKAGSKGLGLSISKTIVDEHQGKIWASNEEKGAKICFTLPIFHKKNTKDLVTNKNILILDDEESCLESMKLILLGTNYNLYTANNYNDALNLITTHNIKILFLDLMMPEFSGLEVLKKLKKIKLLDSLIVIIQTGISNINEINNAISLGAEAYIAKPYNSEVILQCLEKFLSE